MHASDRLRCVVAGLFVPRRQARAKSPHGLTIAAVDIQRPWFVARCDLVRQTVRRAGCGATLNATELRALDGLFLYQTHGALVHVFLDPP
jgi:hypothetical protein